jgi:non-specific serine/threonine protein kinase
MDDQIGVALCLDALAWIAASQKKPDRALALLAAADAVWAAIPALLPAVLRQHHDVALGTARQALPGSKCRAAAAKGSAMSQAEAIAFALGEAPQPGQRSDGAKSGAADGQLTHREQEVAALVSRGLSNSQIAGTLVISARTAETHVQHIMTKLGFSSRAEIAAWSATSHDDQSAPWPGPGR